MLIVISANILGAGVLWLDNRTIDRDFWIALAVLTVVLWGGYAYGIDRKVLG